MFSAGARFPSPVSFALIPAAFALIGICSAQTSGPVAGPKLEGPLTLAQAIEAALRNNPVLAASRSEFDASSASVRSARSALAPQVSLNSYATSGSYNTIIGSSPGVMPPTWIAAPAGGFVDQNVTLMVPLLTGGRLQADVSSATWLQQAAAGGLSEAVGEVALQVTETYLKNLLAHELLLVQQAKVDSATEMLRTTQAQFDAGKGIEASVLRVRAELAHAKRGLATAKNDAAKSLIDLDAVMGADLGSAITPTDRLEELPPVAVLDSYLSHAVLGRGKVIAARARSEGSASDIRAIEAERAPQLYGQAMGDVGSTAGSRGAAIGLTLSIPVFDGGRISADVSASKARFARAKSEVASATLEVQAEVRKAYLDVQTAQLNADSARASVAAQQAAYDVIALRVAAGKSILLEQLDALEALTEAKADLARAIYDQRIATAELEHASGGMK